jgi:nicotinamidase-related amidase
METPKYDKAMAALLVIDPYNHFISEGGKVWDRLKDVAEANQCVRNMLKVLNAGRKAALRVFYAMHHRYRPGDYETWVYCSHAEGRLADRKSGRRVPFISPSANAERCECVTGYSK